MEYAYGNWILVIALSGLFIWFVYDAFNWKILYNSIQEHPAIHCGDELNAVVSSSFGGKPRSLERGGCHKAVKNNTLATKGPYGYIRHPQYEVLQKYPLYQSYLKNTPPFLPSLKIFKILSVRKSSLEGGG